MVVEFNDHFQNMRAGDEYEYACWCIVDSMSNFYLQVQ